MSTFDNVRKATQLLGNKTELFMEFGKTDAVDEASGLLSACSQRGECLIYTAQGDIIGRVAPGWGQGITYDTRPDDIMSG